VLYPAPVLRMAASRSFSDLTQKGRPMVIPHLPWKFHANRSSLFLVGPNFADKETRIKTNKETKKSIENNRRLPQSIRQFVLDDGVVCAGAEYGVGEF